MEIQRVEPAGALLARNICHSETPARQGRIQIANCIRAYNGFFSLSILFARYIKKANEGGQRCSSAQEGRLRDRDLCGTSLPNGQEPIVASLAIWGK